MFGGSDVKFSTTLWTPQWPYGINTEKQIITNFGVIISISKLFFFPPSDQIKNNKLKNSTDAAGLRMYLEK